MKDYTHALYHDAIEAQKLLVALKDQRIQELEYALSCMRAERDKYFKQATALPFAD